MSKESYPFEEFLNEYRRLIKTPDGGGVWIPQKTFIEIWFYVGGDFLKEWSGNTENDTKIEWEPIKPNFRLFEPLEPEELFSFLQKNYPLGGWFQVRFFRIVRGREHKLLSEPLIFFVKPVEDKKMADIALSKELLEKEKEEKKRLLEELQAEKEKFRREKERALEEERRARKELEFRLKEAENNIFQLFMKKIDELSKNTDDSEKIEKIVSTLRSELSALRESLSTPSIGGLEPISEEKGTDAKEPLLMIMNNQMQMVNLLLSKLLEKRETTDGEVVKVLSGRLERMESLLFEELKRKREDVKPPSNLSEVLGAVKMLRDLQKEIAPLGTSPSSNMLTEVAKLVGEYFITEQKRRLLEEQREFQFLPEPLLEKKNSFPSVGEYPKVPEQRENQAIDSSASSRERETDYSQENEKTELNKLFRKLLRDGVDPYSAAESLPKELRVPLLSYIQMNPLKEPEFQTIKAKLWLKQFLDGLKASV